MNCELMRTLVHGYLDGELDAARAADFEKHLETCPECVAELEAQESLRSSLRRAQLYEKAPANLRQNVLAAARGVIPQASKPRGIDWRWLAVAAAVLLSLFTGWRVISSLLGGDRGATLVAQIVDAHLRALEPGHLTDVLSTDQHTVKPWFTGKLDFSPPVTDFPEDGFLLQGGRLDVVHGRTVAALVYSRRKHLISVFIWPTAEKDSAPASGAQQGYHWIDWRKGGMEFAAISDVSPADLDQLQRLLSR
jgi:mycothiol system anti-sigma-R factor